MSVLLFANVGMHVLDYFFHTARETFRLSKYGIVSVYFANHDLNFLEKYVQVSLLLHVQENEMQLILEGKGKRGERERKQVSA